MDNSKYNFIFGIIPYKCKQETLYQMIGRKKEIGKIERLLNSNRSEFLAVTGRRRVGKTFLIDKTLKEQLKN